MIKIDISPQKGTFEDDFPFPQVGYVNSLEGRLIMVDFVVNSPLIQSLLLFCWLLEKIGALSQFFGKDMDKK